ncbi:MAG: hypothetical protein Q8R79_01235 [Legionellaceae bacterium]|nr:hypothetical protein [Legionellaceae bacterium]
MAMFFKPHGIESRPLNTGVTDEDLSILLTGVDGHQERLRKVKAETGSPNAVAMQTIAELKASLSLIGDSLVHTATPVGPSAPK